MPSRSRSPYQGKMTKVPSIAEENKKSSASQAAALPNGVGDKNVDTEMKDLGSEGPKSQSASTSTQGGGSQSKASEPRVALSHGTAFVPLAEGDHEGREEMEELRNKFAAWMSSIDDPLHGPSLSKVRDTLEAIPERFLGIGDMPEILKWLSQKTRLGKHQKKAVLARIEEYFELFDELTKMK